MIIQRMLLAILLISMLCVMCLGPTLISKDSEAYGRIIIRRGIDEVYMDVNISYHGSIDRATPSFAKLLICYNSTYVKSSELYENLYTDFIISISRDYTWQYVYPSFTLDIGGSFRHGVGDIIIRGNVYTVNGSIDFDLNIQSMVYEKSITISINGNISIDKALVAGNTEQTIKMMNLVSPELINLQLARMGITWLNFSRLKINVIDANIGYILNIDAVVNIDVIGYVLSQLGNTDIEQILKSLEISKSMVADFNYSLKLTQASYGFKLQTKRFIKHIDIENIYRDMAMAQHSMAINMFIANNYRDEMKHLQELVILPGNSSIDLEVQEKDGMVNVETYIHNIRVRHKELTGNEAIKRIGTIVLSLAKTLETFNIHIDIETDIDIDMDSVNELVPEITKLIHGLLSGEALARSYLPYISNIFGVHGAWTTTTTVTTSPWTTTETMTTTRPIIESIILTTITKTITRSIPISITSIITTTELVTTTTTTVGKDYVISIVLLGIGLVIGIVIGYIVKHIK